jgi:hypothetical protein
LGDWLGGKGTFAGAFIPKEGTEPDIPAPPNQSFLTNKVGEAIGGWHKPETPGEQLAEAASQGTIGALISGGPGAFIPRVATQGAIPAVAGEKARQLTEGVKVPGWVPGVGGKNISPAVGMLTSAFTPSKLRKAVTPNTLNDPVRQQQYDTTVRESEGRFTPTYGQLFKDQKAINAELAAQPNINREQSAGIMQTATQHTGDPTTDITYGQRGNWVDRNRTRTGNAIDQLEQNTHIQPGGNTVLPNGNTSYAVPDLVNVAMHRPQDVPDILRTIASTDRHLTPHATALPEEQIHSALFNSIGTRPLTGEQYRRVRTNLHSAAENAASPEQAHSYRQVAGALDDAMNRTNPDWGRDWNTARREYAHTLVGQELAAKAKQGQTRFTPDEIAGATKSVMGKVPHVRGELESSPFISSAGAFPPLKKGKVPENYPAYQNIPVIGPLAGHALNWAPAIMGPGLAAAMYKMGYPPELSATTGILGGMTAALPKLMDKVKPMVNPMNPALQWHKKNTVLPFDPDARNRAMVIQGLMAGQRSSGNQ